MDGIDIDIDEGQLNSTLNIFSSVGKIITHPKILSALMEWGNLIEKEAKRLIPVKTGEARDHINHYLLSETASEVIVKVSTAQQGTPGSPVPFWLEYGTKAHWVAPLKASALHWQMGGKDCFSKGHTVSGIQPLYFMFRSFLNTKSQGQELLAQAMIDAIQDIKDNT